MIASIIATIDNDRQRNELNEIYAQNAGKFFDIAYSKLADRDDAQDAVQEAFSRIADHPDSLFAIPADKRVSYINVTIRNVSYEMLRKRKKVNRNEVELSDEIKTNDLPYDEKIITDYSAEKILEFIGSLPTTMQEVVFLKTHFSLKYSQIANLLNITEPAVKERIYRAMQLIKHFLEENNE